MKRLIKKSGNLGKDYFNSSDLNFDVTSSQISITIVNEEKIVDEAEQYNGTYFDFGSKNEIGRIQYKLYSGYEDFQELQHPKDVMDYELVIDIEAVELRPEYRGTNAIWMGFDKFCDFVQSHVNDYGEENICIISTFENYDFSQRLPSYISSKVDVEFKSYY